MTHYVVTLEFLCDASDPEFARQESARWLAEQPPEKIETMMATAQVTPAQILE